MRESTSTTKPEKDDQDGSEYIIFQDPTTIAGGK